MIRDKALKWYSSLPDDFSADAFSIRLLNCIITDRMSLHSSDNSESLEYCIPDLKEFCCFILKKINC